MHNNPKPIILSHKEKILAFAWGILNAAPSHAYEIHYQLDGFEDIWHLVRPESGNTAIYTNLAPGSYEFRLKILPLIDQEPFIALSIPISIQPPYWKTWWFFICIFLLFGTALYSLYRYRLRSLLREEKIRTDFNEKLAKLEINHLRSQMNPHFMFNSLNSIKLFILKNEREMAADYLSNFADLIRDILNYSKEDFICLEDEIKTLRTYIDLEQLRLQDPIDVQFEIDPKIDLRRLLVQPLILQPFVENAIWHGLTHKKGKKLLRLSFRQESRFLICEIEDNGIGRELASTFKTRSGARRSYGIEITKERISSQNNKNSIEVIDLQDQTGHPAGTLVVLKLVIKIQ